MRKFNVPNLIVALVMTVSGNVYADEAALLNMVRNLESQMAAMQTMIHEQGKLITELQAPKGGYIVPAGESYRQGNLTEKTHPWLKGLSQKGDVRLRYEAINGEGGTSSGQNDRNRFRYRLRYGIEKELNGLFEGDKMKVGFRLSSGDDGGITSTNDTFDSQFGLKDILVNRVYAKYYPDALKVGPVTNVEIGGGKFANPFGKGGGSTWLMWDGDVEPEGLYEKFEFGLMRNEDFDLQGTLTLGQLVVEEGGGTNNDDAELFAYQAGLKTNIKDAGIKTSHWLSFYDFRDFNSPGNFGASGNNSTCGTSLCTNFKIIDIYNEIGFDLPGVDAPFKIYFDLIKNLDDSAKTKATGEGMDIAWMLGAKLGSAEKKGDWELQYEYAQIEQAAVPGVFTDSDFNGGGGDSRGSKFGGTYMLTDNLTLATTMFFTNRLQTGNTGIIDEDFWMSQVDLIWGF